MSLRIFGSYKLVDMDKPAIIHRFLTQRTPAAVCDDCLATETGVSPRQQVNPIARALSLTTDFDRATGTCSVCHNEKLVTRSLRHAKRA